MFRLKYLSLYISSTDCAIKLDLALHIRILVQGVILVVSCQFKTIQCKDFLDRRFLKFNVIVFTLQTRAPSNVAETHVTNFVVHLIILPNSPRLIGVNLIVQARLYLN